MVGRTSAWSIQIRVKTPWRATPGPTKPSQVWPISFWMSPWFQANAGLMQVSQVDVGKVGDEVVRVGEEHEGRVARRIAGREHVQRLHAGLVGHLHQQVVGRAGVRIDRGQAGDAALERRA